MAKLVWRVKLVAELGTEIVSETEVGRIERDDQVTPETLGLALEEGKRLVAAVQAEMVGAQVTAMGERFRWCRDCGTKLISKGYYAAIFRCMAMSRSGFEDCAPAVARATRRTMRLFRP